MRRKRYRITPMGYIVLSIMALVVIVSVYFIVWSIRNKINENSVNDPNASFSPTLGDSVLGSVTPSPTLPPVDSFTPTPSLVPTATDTPVISSSSPSPSATPTPTPTVVVSVQPTTDEEKAAYDGTLTGSGVALRGGPTTSDTIIKKYDKGTALRVYGTYGDYYKVQVLESKTYGFIATKFVSKAQTPDGMISGTITASKLAIRSGPSTDTKAKGELVSGDSVYVLFQTDGFYYIQVVTSGVKGYVKGTYVKADGTVPSGTPVPE